MTEYSSSGSSPVFHVQSWAERNGFADWAVAFLWLVVVWVLFQVLGGLVMGVLLVLSGGISSPSPAAIMESMADRMDLLFIGNSTGQVLVIGLATFLVVRLHTTQSEKKRTFLRINWKEDTPLYILLSAILIVVIQPVVVYLGYLNSLFPIPESFLEMQTMQYDMMKQFLATDGILWIALFHIALVPAVCEEVLFRGYVLRAFEKSWGMILAILISGIIFGLFHLQLGNILPLAALGMVLAIMTWLSGSIWPAIIAHLLNNGGGIFLVIYFPELPFGEITAETLPPVWILLLSILFAAVVLQAMLTRSGTKWKPKGIGIMQ